MTATEAAVSTVQLLAPAAALLCALMMCPAPYIQDSHRSLDHTVRSCCVLLLQAEKVRTKEVLALDFYPGYAHHMSSPGLSFLKPLQHSFFMAVPAAGPSLAPGCSRTTHCSHSSEMSSWPWHGSDIERWEGTIPPLRRKTSTPLTSLSESGGPSNCIAITNIKSLGTKHRVTDG